MKAQKDIGKFIERKFDGFTKEPSEDLWGRIENSIEKKKKRRRFLFFWLIGGAIALLLAGFLMKPTTHLTEQTSEIFVEISPLRVEEDSGRTKCQIADSLSPTNKQGDEVDVLVDVSEENKNPMKVDTQTHKANYQHIEPVRGDTQDPWNDKNSSIKTTYNYYNSKLDTIISTTEKLKMDQLLQEKEKEYQQLLLDSLDNFTLDSLELHKEKPIDQH